MVILIDSDDNNNTGGELLVGPLVLSWTSALPLAQMLLSLFLSLRSEVNHDDTDDDSHHHNAEYHHHDDEYHPHNAHASA